MTSLYGTRVLALATTAILIIFAAMRAGGASAPQKSAAVPDRSPVHDYLEVVSSGDRTKMNAFVETHYEPGFLKRLPAGMEEMVVTANLAPYYESAGLGYEIRGTDRPGPNQWTATLVNRLTGACARLLIRTGPDAPYRISDIVAAEPATCPEGVETPKRLSDREILERLKKCMAKLAGNDEFSGAVLLARDGKALFRQAYGLASKAYNVPNKLDTKFNIASVGKIFTAVAIAQLAQRDKLSLEDPVSKYLSADWLQPEVAARIQIRHLLTHTSGLGDYFNKLYASPSPLVFRGLADYRPLIAGLTPTFPSGTRQSYSNAGYLLLGVIIEQVSGGSFENYLRKNIFEVAGMSDTDDSDKDLPVPNRATGYTKVRLEGKVSWRNNEATRVMKGGPSGGMFSTVDDLLRFDTALRSHRLLSPEYTKIVLTPKPEIQAPNMGYGFYLGQTDAGWVASHSGDGYGISSQYQSFLEAGYTVAVLSNCSRPAANIVDSVLRQLIARR